MDEEPVQFCRECIPVFLCLSSGYVEVDDDVAENDRPGAGSQRLTAHVSLGEGKHISSPVQTAEGAVQYPHPAVIDQENAQFSLVKAEMPAHFPENVCYPPKVCFYEFLLVL